MTSDRRALSCPEKTSEYGKNTLQSGAFESPEGGSDKFQYQQPAIFPSLMKLWKQTIFLAAATAEEECGTVTPNWEMQDMYVYIQDILYQSAIFLSCQSRKRNSVRGRGRSSEEPGD